MEKNFCKIEQVNGEINVHLFTQESSLSNFCTVCLMYALFCQEEMKKCDHCKDIADTDSLIIHWLFKEAGLSDLLDSFLKEISKLG